MICLSSAGSLASFDGGSEKQTRATQRAREYTQAHPAQQTVGGEPYRTHRRKGNTRQHDSASSETTTTDTQRNRYAQRRSYHVGVHTHGPSPQAEKSRTRARCASRQRSQLEPAQYRARTHYMCRTVPRQPRSGHAQSARPGGWRRHSKKHAPRRNLEAPVAFKGSMIH